MRLEATRAISRRAVAWDPDKGLLTVGHRTVTLNCASGDNECILRTYLHLVAEQREVRLDRSVVLRRDDVLVLAELLDLDDVRLERQLASILRLTDRQARELRRELLRQRVTVAAFGVGLAAALPIGVAAADEPARPVVAATASAPDEDASKAGLSLVPTTATTAITVEAPVTSTTVTGAAPVAAASSVPAPAEDAVGDEDGDEVEIGYSVTYEQDPNFVPPEGVEIGSAMVIERELPGE